ncbi:MAG: hypothetical protein V2I82_15405 [Halieaceae bacterium]|jgi:hypothetical protein|nr:hypothetical protein [Halieaceae bacterium]
MGGVSGDDELRQIDRSFYFVLYPPRFSSELPGYLKSPRAALSSTLSSALSSAPLIQREAKTTEIAAFDDFRAKAKSLNAAIQGFWCKEKQKNTGFPVPMALFTTIRLYRPIFAP